MIENNQELKKKAVIRIPRELSRKLKAKAASLGRTMQEFAEDIITAAIDSEGEKNENTD